MEFEEALVCHVIPELPYKPGNDFFIVCGMTVYAGTAEYLCDAIREHGDFTARSTFSDEPKEALFRIVGTMLTNMHLVATHDLCWPILLRWRDICRDASTVGFDMGFLQSYLRELVFFLYTCQHRKTRLATLEI